MINRPYTKFDHSSAARPERDSGRFFINEHGIVFLPGLEDGEQPLFVARIDVNSVNWFPKPDQEEAREAGLDLVQLIELLLSVGPSELVAGLDAA